MFHLIGGRQNPSWIPFLQQNKNYCVLGICLGAQTMNVAAGGTLYQDIPSEIYKQKTNEGILHLSREKIHSSWHLRSLYQLEKDFAPAFHSITFKKKGLFVKKMKFKREDKPLVLSSHHQAIKKLGKNLVIIATSRDGKIVEAISHAKYKRVLGVQFHPEHYNLFLKSKFFKKDPKGKVNFNLREYLLKNPPSMKFHRKIWEWFSDSLK